MKIVVDLQIDQILKLFGIVDANQRNWGHLNANQFKRIS